MQAEHSRRVASHGRWALDEGWELGRLPPDLAQDPQSLANCAPAWLPATVPGTVASAHPSLTGIDADDWWYRCVFPSPPNAAEFDRLQLCFHGLATHAEAWLNDERVLCSSNMFEAHVVDVTHTLKGVNLLLIRFASLDAQLAIRKPRPRWRTPMVSHQNLRWHRTSLIGRMPGWSPPVPPLGPWGGVTLEGRRDVQVDSMQLEANLEGTAGSLHMRAQLQWLGARPLTDLALQVGTHRFAIDWHLQTSTVAIDAKVRLAEVIPWWPHTHGPRSLYPVSLHACVDGDSVRIDCGRVGFRSLVLDTEGGNFSFRINGEPVFCRGACWTPIAPAKLLADSAAYRETLESVRDAGMNMLRIAGTMCYEADTFYDLCDELGILVWQDFMFARMDYPGEDPAFLASVQREAFQLLARIGHRPSLALLCGNSEVEQVAAMVGQPRDAWRSPLFADHLPSLCRDLCPQVPYWPSSPSGGSLPFDNGTGVAHYFGVGGYQRPLDDVRRAEVRFASECLAFANVPDDDLIDRWLDQGQAPTHHPDWKARVPRDMGVGWDFDDVRDHYLKQLFRVDPTALRACDRERYLALSRIVTGEAMAAVLAEWRRARSPCQGALIWLLRDLWPGPGWGVLDSEGTPKAAYYYVKRAYAPVAAFLSDEGLNGLAAHLINETDRALAVNVRLHVYRGAQAIASTCRPMDLAPHSTQEQRVHDWLASFLDLTYAYRFGPSSHDLIWLGLEDADSAGMLHEAYHFPQGYPLQPDPELGLQGEASEDARGDALLSITSRKLAYGVHIDTRGYATDTNYLSIPPGQARVVRLRRRHGTARPVARLRAINGTTSVSVEWPSPSGGVPSCPPER